MKKIKILHLVPGLDAGGISVLLLNYYKKMDRNKIQFDFAIFHERLGMTGKEFEKMGSKIYILPQKKVDFKGYIGTLRKILEENNYEIVHAHQNYQSFIPLKIAKDMGVRVRIAHSHTTLAMPGIKQKIYYMIGKIGNKIYATDKFACGIEAGKFLYGNKEYRKGNVFILNNAIDIKKYVYNENTRQKKREELGIDDSFVIGNIGRLSAEKNQKFAIDVLAELCKVEPTAKLLIVGNGELEKDLKEYAKQSGVIEKTIFLGRRSDVCELLQAFDVFILPSLIEGLPIVGVEAISASIPCLFADCITKELKLRENIEYIKGYNPKEWCSKILFYQNFIRKENSKDVMMRLYDINTNARNLEDKYIEILQERNGENDNK